MSIREEQTMAPQDRHICASGAARGSFSDACASEAVYLGFRTGDSALRAEALLNGTFVVRSRSPRLSVLGR